MKDLKDSLMKWNFHRNFFVAASLLVISPMVSASDFSLPFVNVSELGNMYSGVAASATDASTSYTNPAGLVKLKSPELVLGGINVYGTTQFHGTTTTLISSETATTNGNMGGFIPLFYYSHPINENVVFGFGENAPFGLGTKYSKTSPLRYTATTSKIIVVDLSPSIGIKLNDQYSVGFGFDAEQINLTLHKMIGFPLAIPDADSQNYVHGWGYGFHAGIMDQVTPAARLGLTYHSQVMFHANGYSQVFATSGNFRTYQRANTALPALTQLSLDYDVNPKLAAMATVSYTHWSTLQQVTLKNYVLPGGFVTPVTIPFEYHNTLDYAAGLNYKANDKWILRTGMQYLNTPSNNRNRSVVDPLGNAILLAVGAHYQKNAVLGFDFGYAHQFAQTTHINTVTPISSAIGHEWISPNVFGAQLTWNV